jgi:hypothetical protein
MNSTNSTNFTNFTPINLLWLHYCRKDSDVKTQSNRGACFNYKQKTQHFNRLCLPYGQEEESQGLQSRLNESWKMTNLFILYKLTWEILFIMLHVRFRTHFLCQFTRGSKSFLKSGGKKSNTNQSIGCWRYKDNN